METSHGELHDFEGVLTEQVEVGSEQNREIRKCEKQSELGGLLLAIKVKDFFYFQKYWAWLMYLIL